MRIARGSGRIVQDVMEMIQEYKRLAKAMSKIKGKIPNNVQYMGKALPPQVLKQMGGVGGLQSFMKQMDSNKGGARLSSYQM